jgi:hypothetical protein
MKHLNKKKHMFRYEKSPGDREVKSMLAALTEVDEEEPSIDMKRKESNTF